MNEGLSVSVPLLTTFDFYCDLLTGQGFLSTLFLACKRNYVVLILMKFHKSGLPLISVIQNLVVSNFPFLVSCCFWGWRKLILTGPPRSAVASDDPLFRSALRPWERAPHGILKAQDAWEVGEVTSC